MKNLLTTNKIGEIAAFVNDRDWSQTPLGDRQNWSSELKAAVQILVSELDRAGADTMPECFSPVVCDRNYQVLFNSISQGFGICEMIFDDRGQPSDYLFLEVNNLFAAMAGLEPEQLVGNTAYTLFPHLESLWAETYGRVVKTGNPIEFEHYFAHVDRWYEINAFVIDDPQQHRFGILYNEKRDSLRDTSRSYDALFDSIDQGFCICEMIFDDLGQPLDYLFLEINNKYESMTGLTNVIGRTAREILPGLEEFWFETYGRVVQTGKSERFENYVSAMYQWFDVNAFPIESANNYSNNNRFGVLFTDISDRKHRELSSNFLAEIQSDLERLATPNEIKRVVGAKIYNWFGFSLLTFNDIDATGTKGTVIYHNRDLDIPDAVSTHHLPDYFSEVHLNRLRTGEIVAIDDVTTDVDIKASDADRHDEYLIRSMVTVPYLNDGQWKFAICGCRREASIWRQDEIELIDELTARIYLRIDRARAEIALSESEARFRNVADTAPVLIWMSGTDKLCNYFNQYWLDFSGRSLEQEMGNGWAEGVYADDFQFCLDTYGTAFDARQPFQREYRLRRFDGQYRWLIDTAQPRFTPEGEFLGYIGSCIDIEDRKRQESNNNFLAEIQKDLTALGDPTEIMSVVGEKIRCFFGISLLFFADIDAAADRSTVVYNNREADLLDSVDDYYLPDYLSNRYLEQLKAGNIVTISDTHTDPDVVNGGAAYLPYEVRSQVLIPHFNNGKWKFMLGGSRREPSIWRTDELELIDELTARLYLCLDRARAEIVLQEVKQRLQISLTAGDVGVWDLDLVTMDAWRSIEHDRIFGYDLLLPEWTYEVFLSHVIPQEREWVNAEFQTAIATHTPWEVECSIQRIDGETRWIWTRATSEYNEKGEPVRMHGVVKDISDRKRQELNNTFLSEIQKDLTIYEDPVQIMSLVGEKIRVYFGFSIMTFTSVDYDKDEAKVVYNNRESDVRDAVYTHRMSDYLSATHIHNLNNGEIVAIADVTTDPDIKDGGASYVAFQVRSTLSIPYVRDGVWKSFLSGCRREPSNWREDEIELMRELAERVYLRIERAQSAATLNTINQRFETVMQSVNGIVFEWDMPSNRVYRSEGLFQLTGVYAQDAAPTKEWWMERIHPEDIPQIEATFANFLTTNADRYQSEYRLRHEDGRWIDVWEQGQIQRNAAGELIGLIGFTSDISDRKYAERRLRESERIYRAIGETLDYGIWINDPNGQNMYTSPSFLELLGITQAECAGLDWGKYLHPDESDRTVRAWLECVRTEGNWDIEHHYLGVDGRYHPILARGVPVRGDGGEIICWAGINLDISKLKQTEQLLRQSEDRLGFTLESTQTATWDIDLTSGEAIWSKQHFTMLGYEPIETGEATYEMWECRIHPDDRTRVQQEWQRSQQNHSLYRCEYRVYRADNNQIAWLSGTGSFTYDANDRAIRSIGVVLDISDRKFTEEALYFSRQRMDLVLDSVELGLWYCNLPFDVLEWNDTCKQHFGLTPETIVTIDLFYEHIHPSDRLRVEQEISKSVENHKSYDIDYRTVGHDGQVRWVRAIGRGFYDANGTPIRFDGVTIDVTDRKRTESALKHSEERYRNLIELIPQLVWTADHEGKATDVNQRWLDFTDVSRLEEAQNIGLTPFIHPDEAEIMSDRWILAQQEQVAFQAEGRIRRHDGIYIWHLHQAIPIKNDRGEIIKWFGSSTDIEAQKQLEYQYQTLLQKVQERNQELDQFTHIVSHDLKAPLRGISNLAQWLEDDLEDLIPPENKEQLQLMRSRVFRMEALINGLLNYASVARKDIPLEVVSIEELLSETIDSLDPPSTFTVEITQPLPTFTTKRILLNQVLANLIGNGIKHHGRPDGKVKVSVEAETEFYRFNITDDGKGIDPSQQSRVFDVFQTIEGQDKQQGQNQSTGIGLAIVKKIVEAEGGEIQLTSEIGKGSTFSFTWRK